MFREESRRTCRNLPEAFVCSLLFTFGDSLRGLTGLILRIFNPNPSLRSLPFEFHVRDNRVANGVGTPADFSAFDLHRFRHRASRSSAGRGGARGRGTNGKDEGRKRRNSTGNVGSVIFVSIPISFSLAGLISSGKLAVAL